jgi:hypothetical protein
LESERGIEAIIKGRRIKDGQRREAKRGEFFGGK